jgi:hypothetical protein
MISGAAEGVPITIRGHPYEVFIEGGQPRFASKASFDKRVPCLRSAFRESAEFLEMRPLVDRGGPPKQSKTWPKSDLESDS